MNLAERRAAALSALSQRTPSTPQRYPGETQPSGDIPDDPWQAAAYFAERGYLYAEALTTEELLAVTSNPHVREEQQ